MKIAIATDHRGLHLKDLLRRQLEAAGHEVRDFGPQSPESVDYPDYAERVARAVARGEVERGILACGTGIGMCIAANKVRGVRAAVCWDVFSARRSREHNDANVLCLGSETTSDALASEMVAVWLQTPAEGGRHQRRVRKIRAIEQEEEDADRR